MRKCLSRGTDASTRPDVGDLDAGCSCGTRVNFGSLGVGGAGTTQMKGLRT